MNNNIVSKVGEVINPKKISYRLGRKKFEGKCTLCKRDALVTRMFYIIPELGEVVGQVCISCDNINKGTVYPQFQQNKENNVVSNNNDIQDNNNTMENR